MERADLPAIDVSAQLVPGRECGSCNVCCVALTINDPALRKPQGLRCGNARRDNSCAVYTDRPKTCRDFFCGWRLLRWVKESMRPDRSGVLITLRGMLQDGSPQLGINITLLDRKALRADGLAESAAAAINADIPTYLTIPGPPGYTSSTARLNEVLRPAVIAHDKPGVLDILRNARSQGNKGSRTRIVLKAEDAPETPPPAVTG